MNLAVTCRKIRSLEIQGATNVAMAALKAMEHSAANSKARTPPLFFAEMKKAKGMLFATRPTEPLLRNYLNYFISLVSGKNVKQLIDSAKWAYAIISARSEQARQKMEKNAASLIKNNYVVYTHCHASSVTKGIILAARTKKVSVCNTETRPRFQGRITAEELAKAGVKVTHYVDSAAKIALTDADIMLIGADAITPSGIYNKIGSGLFAEEANRMRIPFYVCSLALKVDPLTLKGKQEMVEMRDADEVWQNAPSGVRVMNPAFEKVDMNLVKAIVSELGVLKPKDFFRAVKKAYPWMMWKGY